ncbi:MAG: dihydrodipicolinate synthase family protein [Gammaproteobacteria bacterium]
MAQHTIRGKPSRSKSALVGMEGVYVPLLTPFQRGALDHASLAQLIAYTEPHVSGFVPCLSSGEGNLIGDTVWSEVIRTVREHTRKPVIAGIKRASLQGTVTLAQQAAQLDCDAIMVPAPSADEDDIIRYCTELAQRVSLPIALYNTEQHHLRTLGAVERLQHIPTLIGIKDSSMNSALFAEMCALRAAKALRLSVLQGMEHQMRTPKGCDGYVVALANVEPELCHEMFLKNSDAIGQRIIDLFWRYNLGGQWYISLKAILMERGILQSAEETQVAISPP